MRRPTIARPLLAATATLALLVACTPGPGGGRDAHGAAAPADAVRALNAQLVDNDLAGFTRTALPPDLYARLDLAWREGRTRWPLDELPFGESTPQIMATLAADDAERSLQAMHRRQFAGAASALRQAAEALGLFGVQYVRTHGQFSDDERQHYAQLIHAASRWAMHAPLSDPDHARTAIATLVGAARSSGLVDAQAFADAGVEDGLARMSGMVAAGKQVLKGYGLDLDQALASMDVQLESQTGDKARVRMRYALAGEPLDTAVGVERIDGRWYVSDFLVNAREAVGPEPAADTPAEPRMQAAPRAPATRADGKS